MLLKNNVLQKPTWNIHKDRNSIWEKPNIYIFPSTLWIFPYPLWRHLPSLPILIPAGVQPQPLGGQSPTQAPSSPNRQCFRVLNSVHSPLSSVLPRGLTLDIGERSFRQSNSILKSGGHWREVLHPVTEWQALEYQGVSSPKTTAESEGEFFYTFKKMQSIKERNSRYFPMTHAIEHTFF